MPFQIFQYRIPETNDLEDLNKFLASHRVVVVDRHVVTAASGSLLVFIVEYLAGKSGDSVKQGEIIDYRDVLPPNEFVVFARLKDLRREISESEAVPLYKVFTNAQLAQMVQQRCTSKAMLQRIAGVGSARADKYSARFLEVLKASFTDVPEVREEGSA